MAIKSKTSLNIKPNYDDKAIVAALGDKPAFTFAMLFGSAFDVIERANQVDPDAPFKGFTGQFESVPAVAGWDTFTSGQLFLPDTLRDAIAPTLDKVQYPDPVNADGTPQMKDGKPVVNDRRKKDKAVVEFALSATAKKADNKAGYTVEYAWAIQPRQADPFAAMKAQLDRGAATPNAEAAPAKPKGKAA